MEKYMQNYLQIMQAVVSGKKVPKIQGFTQQDVFDIQQLMLDFNNLVRYEDNDSLHDSQLAYDAIVNDLFFTESLVEDSTRYYELISSNNAVRKLLPGQSYSEKDFQRSSVSSTEIRNVYVKEQGEIKKYIQLAPYYRVQSVVYPISRLNDVLAMKGAYKQGNMVFVPHPVEDEEMTCIIEGDKLILLGYDVRKNPFEKGHFRAFNNKGEITNIEDLNHTEILRKIRNSEAHHSVYTYQNGRGYGAKVVKISNKKAVLFSNRWHEAVIRMSSSTFHGKDDKYVYLFVPHSTKSIRTDQACIDKIDSIRVVEMFTQKQYDADYAQAILSKIVSNYEILESTKLTLEEYLAKHLTKHIPDATFKVTKPQNTQILKSRLVGDSKFYNIFPKEKENGFAQESFIQMLVNQFYGYDLISKFSVSLSGKIMPIKVNLQDYASLLNVDLCHVHNQIDVKNKVFNYPQAHTEKQIALAALCAYKHLIRNGFVDDANDIRFKTVGFVDEPAKQQLRNELYLLDMKMFEIYNPNKGRKEVINPTTLNQKISVLRAIRNAISHNCLSVQFNRLCDINDSKFVFELSEDNNMQARVNVKQFMEFINNPLFANYNGNQNTIINAKNEDELKKFIIQLCNSQPTLQNDSELGE